ncbi:hypothetical protein F5888DRAFT_1801871 [Russula emetica]|nr:hypothetical protein F5888DRAFT_1801871 [Russula emetica]
MSTTAVSPSYRLRIAIGLVALKFKPPEQSVHTYILNLKYYLCRSASRPVSEECDAWRKRALELEAELEATRAAVKPEPTPSASKKKRKQTNQGAELETTQAGAIPGDVGTTKHTPSASKRKGKQTKKLSETLGMRRSQALNIPSTATGPSASDTISSGNNALLRHPHDTRMARAGYMRVDVEQPGSSLWTSNKLFPSLRALDDIATQISTKPASPPEATRLVAATFRCLEVLHDLLARAISPEPSAPEGPTPGDTLEGIERILPDILRTAVTYLNGAYIQPSSVLARPGWHTGSSDNELIRPGDKTSAFNLVLGRVITELLLPVIRALVPCTLTKTEYILASIGPGTPKKDFVDGTQLLSLTGAVLDALPDPQHIILYDRVALEAVRELTSLILNQPSRVPYAQQTPAQRVHRIARKDALHFLCDTILLAFRIRRSAPALPGSPEEMIRIALSDALGNLALTQSVREGGSGLDTVEEHYVMAVLERAWGVGLRVGHIDGDSESADIDMGYHDVYDQG